MVCVTEKSVQASGLAGSSTMKVQKQHILWDGEEFRLVSLGSPKKQARLSWRSHSQDDSVRRVEKRPLAALGHNSSSRVPVKSQVQHLLAGIGSCAHLRTNQSLWPRKGSILIGGAWLSTHLSPGASAGKQSVIKGPRSRREQQKSR